MADGGEARARDEDLQALLDAASATVDRLADVPFPVHPTSLYSSAALAEGFDSAGYAGMFDTVVHDDFLASGGSRPSLRTSLVRLMHDVGMRRALGDVVEAWRAERRSGTIVGVMGGHAERRDSPGYRLAADLGRRLAREGRLVVTGGGPGVMEAVNLGSYFAGRPDDELDEAVDALAEQPLFTEHEPYTAAAVEVRRRFPVERAGDAASLGHAGGLAISTWLNDIPQPANLFVAETAKYLSDAIPEDQLLDISDGGVIFAEGRAGTVQEVFLAVTKLFYGLGETGGPLVFLGRDFWETTMPVASLVGPLLSGAKGGDLRHLVHVTDDAAETVAILAEAGGAG